MAENELEKPVLVLIVDLAVFQDGFLLQMNPNGRPETPAQAI